MEMNKKDYITIKNNMEFQSCLEPVYCALECLEGPSNNKHPESLSCAWLGFGKMIAPLNSSLWNDQAVQSLLLLLARPQKAPQQLRCQRASGGSWAAALMHTEHRRGSLDPSPT